MKTIAGAASFAWANRSRTREAPTPTIASTNSDAAIEKKGASASPATARASSVLPVPGGPASRTPRGILPPSLRYFSGRRRKSTTSESSSLASSIPATSLNVTRSLEGWYRLARDRPNEPRTFCTFPARRIRKKRSPTKRIVGPKKRRRLCHQGEPVSSGCAFTTTPLLCRSFRERVVVGERGNLGLEAIGRLRVPVLLLLLERALDGRALRRDLLHVAVSDLLEEERAVRHTRARRLFHRPRAQVDVQREQREEEKRPVPVQREPRSPRRRRRRGTAGCQRRAGTLSLVAGWRAHVSTLAPSC